MLIVKETWEEFSSNCDHKAQCEFCHIGPVRFYPSVDTSRKCARESCHRLWKATTVEVADNLAELCEDLSETLLKLGMVAAQLDPCDGKDLCDGQPTD